MFARAAGPDEIWTMNGDGTRARRVSQPGRNAFAPVLSPDGRRIAFLIERDLSSSEPYVMQADGTAVTRVERSEGEDGEPVWLDDRVVLRAVPGHRSAVSPDGARVVFESDRDGNPEIYVSNADGSGVRRLTTNPAEDKDPAWSPDGRRIAFATNRDGNFEIYAMNADGSAPVRLTNDPADDTRPSWGAMSSATATVATPAPGPPPLAGTIVLPAGYDAARSYPVVVFLPYTGGTAQDLVRGYPASDRYVSIVVAGRGDIDDYATGDAWWTTILRYERQVLADVARFAAQYRLDTARVVLAGFSMGGDLAWALELRNPARFTGALVMGSRASYRARPADAPALAANHDRIYIAIGDDDIAERLAGARAARTMLEQLGVAYRYVEIPRGGHAPAPAATLAEALAFLVP